MTKEFALVIRSGRRLLHYLLRKEDRVYAKFANGILCTEIESTNVSTEKILKEGWNLVEFARTGRDFIIIVINRSAAN